MSRRVAPVSTFASRAVEAGPTKLLEAPLRYASREALLRDIEEQHEELRDLLHATPRSRYREPGVWGDGWTVHDLIAHLTDWEQRLLGWHREALAGSEPKLPAPGYDWRETPALNRAIQRAHARRSTRSVLDAFESSFEETLAWVRGLSEADLFEKGRFTWTGPNALVSYVGANTASHYRTAAKILRRWGRGVTRPRGAEQAAPSASGRGREREAARVSDLKTRRNSRSVEAFLRSVENPQRRKDGRALLRLMEEVTGERPEMWGDSIVGFGSYRQRYANGREGEWFLTGFSPRKSSLSVYVMAGLSRHGELLSRLGGHKTGKACLYVERLDDIDLEALRALIRESVEQLREG